MIYFYGMLIHLTLMFEGQGQSSRLPEEKGFLFWPWMHTMRWRVYHESSAETTKTTQHC